MNCPPEIADIILDILAFAALRIRTKGWAGDAAGCALEADHIHNLPALLRNYSPDLLRYYWEAERPSFVSHNEGKETGFEPLWDRLSAYAVFG